MRVSGLLDDVPVVKRPAFYEPRSALEARLAAAVRARPLTVIVGPPLIGKTSLVRATFGGEARAVAMDDPRVDALLRDGALVFIDDAHRAAEHVVEAFLDRHLERASTGRLVVASRRGCRRSSHAAFELVVPEFDDETLRKIARRVAPHLDPDALVARACGSPWVLLCAVSGRRLDDDVDPLDGLGPSDRALLEDLRAFPDGVALPLDAGCLERAGLVRLDGGRVRLTALVRATLELFPARRENELAVRVLASSDNHDEQRAALHALGHATSDDLCLARARVLVERADGASRAAIDACPDRSAAATLYARIGELDRACGSAPESRLIALQRSVERGDLAEGRALLATLAADRSLSDVERAEVELRELRLESLAMVTPELLRRVRALSARCRDLDRVLATSCAWLELHCTGADVRSVARETENDPLRVLADERTIEGLRLRLLRELVGRDPLPGATARALRSDLSERPLFIAAAAALVLARDAVLSGNLNERRDALRDVELVLARLDPAGLRVVSVEVEAAHALLLFLLGRHDDVAASIGRLRALLAPLGRTRFAGSLRLLEAAASPQPNLSALVVLAVDEAEGPRTRLFARALLGHIDADQGEAAFLRTLVPFEATVYGETSTAFEPGVVFDGMAQRLLLGARAVDFSGHPIAVAILRELFVHGRASKQTLAERVWGVPKYHPHRDDTRIRVALRRMRALIERSAARRDLLVTDDDGYRLEARVRRWVERRQ